MAGTVTYDHSPNDVVWVITSTCGIKSGVVDFVKINVVASTGSPSELVTVWYDIIMEDGTIGTYSNYVYAEADKASALAQYDLLLG